MLVHVDHVDLEYSLPMTDPAAVRQTTSVPVFTGPIDMDWQGGGKI